MSRLVGAHPSPHFVISFYCIFLVLYMFNFLEKCVGPGLQCLYVATPVITISCILFVNVSARVLFSVINFGLDPHITPAMQCVCCWNSRSNCQTHSKNVPELTKVRWRVILPRWKCTFMIYHVDWRDLCRAHFWVSFTQ